MIKRENQYIDENQMKKKNFIKKYSSENIATSYSWIIWWFGYYKLINIKCKT